MVPLVTVVAAADELILRGVLFDALLDSAGDVFAVVVTAIRETARVAAHLSFVDAATTAVRATGFPH